MALRTPQQLTAVSAPSNPARHDSLAHPSHHSAIPTRPWAILVGVMCLAIIPCNALGGDCVDYGQYVRLIGTFDLNGVGADVVVAAYAYVAASSPGVQILDVSLPSNDGVLGAYISIWHPLMVSDSKER